MPMQTRGWMPTNCFACFLVVAWVGVCSMDRGFSLDLDRRYFQFGGGMPRVRRTGAGSWAQQMHNQRARQADDQQARAPTSWVTFMPIIIFFVISLLQSFPSLFSAPRTPDPTFSWGPSSVYPVQRVTLNHAGVKCKNSLAPRVLYGSVDWASGFEFLQILSIRMNLVLIHSTKPISPPILN